MPCAVRFVDGTIELRQDRLEGEEICLHITSLRHYIVVPLPCIIQTYYHILVGRMSLLCFHVITICICNFILFS